MNFLQVLKPESLEKVCTDSLREVCSKTCYGWVFQSLNNVEKIITMNYEHNSLADCGWNPVARYAEVGAHVKSADSSHIQNRTFDTGNCKKSKISSKNKKFAILSLYKYII